MLWIWQMQSNKVSDLHERNVHIWDEWRVDEDGIYRIYEPKVPGKDYVYDPEKEVVVMDPLSVPVSDPFGYLHEIKPKLDDNGDVMVAKSLIPGKTIKAAKYYTLDANGKPVASQGITRAQLLPMIKDLNHAILEAKEEIENLPKELIE